MDKKTKRPKSKVDAEASIVKNMHAKFTIVAIFGFALALFLGLIIFDGRRDREFTPRDFRGPIDQILPDRAAVEPGGDYNTEGANSPTNALTNDGTLFVQANNSDNTSYLQTFDSPTVDEYDPIPCDIDNDNNSNTPCWEGPAARVYDESNKGKIVLGRSLYPDIEFISHTRDNLGAGRSYQGDRSENYQEITGFPQTLHHGQLKVDSNGQPFIDPNTNQYVCERPCPQLEFVELPDGSVQAMCTGFNKNFPVDGNAIANSSPDNPIPIQNVNTETKINAVNRYDLENSLYSRKVNDRVDFHYTCANHLMFGELNDNFQSEKVGYSLFGLTPSYMMDWSDGKSVLEFEISMAGSGYREFLTISIAPHKDAVQAYVRDNNDNASTLTSAGRPLNVIEINTETEGNHTRGFGEVVISQNGTQRKFDANNRWQPALINSWEFNDPFWDGMQLPDYAPVDLARRDKVRIEIDKNNNRMILAYPGYIPDFNPDNPQDMANRYPTLFKIIDFPNGYLESWNNGTPNHLRDTGIINLSAHNYTNEKSPGENPQSVSFTTNSKNVNTWHLDNLSVFPAKPFQLIETDTIFMDDDLVAQGVDTITLNIPAKENSELRFIGETGGKGNFDMDFFDSNGNKIGEVRNSTDYVPTQFVRANSNIDDVFANWRIPIPEGTKSIKVLDAVNDAVWGHWLLSNVNVWSMVENPAEVSYVGLGAQDNPVKPVEPTPTPPGNGGGGPTPTPTPTPPGSGGGNPTPTPPASGGDTNPDAREFRIPNNTVVMDGYKTGQDVDSQPWGEPNPNGVDIITSAGDPAWAWIDQGETITFDVDVRRSGTRTYVVEAEVAQDSGYGDQASVDLLLNGVKLTEINNQGNTGGWDTYLTVSGDSSFQMTRGKAELTLVANVGSFNIKNIKFSEQTGGGGNPTPTPTPNVTPTPTPRVTPTPTPVASVGYVEDIVAFADNSLLDRIGLAFFFRGIGIDLWVPKFTVTVQGTDGNPVANSVVTMELVSGNRTTQQTCVTTANGTCEISGDVEVIISGRGRTSVMGTITGVNMSETSYTYDASSNVTNSTVARYN